MKLTPEEYRRGLLKWQASAPISITTSATDDTSAPREDSAPLTDPDGSKVSSPPGQFVAIGVRMNTPVVPTAGLRVFWERLVGPRVDTAVWDGDLNFQAARLHHVPAYGFFDRLVIDCRTLLWESDVIYRVSDAMVRFINGSAEVERTTSDDLVQTEEGKPAIQWGQETATVDGRLIDIVSPGTNAETAEQRAYAILGLLALCVGENVVGPVVSSEPYEVLSAREQRGTSRAVIRAMYPRVPSMNELDQMDFLLPLVLNDDRAARARTLALRWYEKGIRADAPIDKLLSFFVAIEALVTAFADQNGPVPPEQERRSRLDEVGERLMNLGAHGKGIWKALRALGLARLVETTLAERFDFYIDKRGLNADLKKRFRELRRKRNEIIHGDAPDVAFEDSSDCASVLSALLKSDVGLVGELPWEKHPKVQTVELTWQYAPQQGSPPS